MRKRNPHKTSDPRRDTEEAVTAVRQIYAELAPHFGIPKHFTYEEAI